MLASVLLLAGCTDFAPAPDQPTSETGASADSASCGNGEYTPATPQRYINLVLDDSGSMFYDEDDAPRDRWSKAKYAVEVFAAMLEPEDTLNVYLLNGGGAPQLTITGSETSTARVEKVHELQLRGGGTPYDVVRRATADLDTADAENKWLVVLSDGDFPDRKVEQVKSDFDTFVANGTDGERRRVAFLSIGEEARELESSDDLGVHSRAAPDSEDVLDQMTDFANLIFERSPIEVDDKRTITPDVDLAEVLVFAQGEDAAIAPAFGPTVIVEWAPNESVDGKTEPTPDKELRGVLATATDVPAGTFHLPVNGTEEIAAFFKPSVDFKVELRNEDGELVTEDDLVGGTYSVSFGFVDQNCDYFESIESTVLGHVDYSATVQSDAGSPDGTTEFQSGDEITLEAGTAKLTVAAEFLQGHVVESSRDLLVRQPTRDTGFDVAPETYNASDLALAAPPPGPVELYYGLGEPGQLNAFTAEEWATVEEESIQVGPVDGLTFDVAPSKDEIGIIHVTPRAANGDVYGVPTGTVDVPVLVEHTYDTQPYDADQTMTFTIVDDIPWYERLAHWFATIGWMILLGLIVAAIIVGYIVKPRFSKKIKPSPTVTGVPMNIGMQSENGTGKFRQRLGRKFLPYVADRATLVYVPHGAPGFRAMQLKAGRRGKMTLLNWKQIADRKNVAINGSDINEDTKKPPTLSPSSNITATVPNQMRYELYLNN
ncbi:hypothetical protein ACFQZV_05350 [Microbacterium koreense]|uniref:VWFA domain-containing protein n=1 Tax=Microbacterium koreense TaxID=323761 RepID=A0ABW2ZQH8_9MICO